MQRCPLMHPFQKWLGMALLAAAIATTAAAQHAPLVVPTQLLTLKAETLLEGLDHPWAPRCSEANST